MMQRILNHYRASFSGIPKKIWLLCLVIFVNRSGHMVLFFMMLYLSKELNFSVVLAGELISVYGLGALVGAYLGGSLSGDPPRLCRMSGFGFVTQAGVSLGLAGIVMRSFPEWGAALSTIIVAVVALNQIIGPIAFKVALGAVGEARVSRGSASSPTIGR